MKVDKMKDANNGSLPIDRYKLMRDLIRIIEDEERTHVT